jgi:A/G-specific adenine glycosylase
MTRGSHPVVSPAVRARFAARLLAWYDAHRRDLPWRRTRDPYAVWVSEMMLQQTQVRTVVGYYTRWMDRFPTLRALAAADEQQVLAAWQGLGYYARARNLRRGAQEVVDAHGGVIPADPGALRRLPGIGRYSAGAIASIAYDQPVPVVDGNVARVLCRHFELPGDPKQGPAERALWSLAGALVPRKRPGDFNQALMELGATVCTPRAPRCGECPLTRTCLARQQGRAEELPEGTERPAIVRLERVAAVVGRRGRTLVVQQPASRWQGLWIFPTTDVQEKEAPLAALRRAASGAGVRVAGGDMLCTVRHAFTHHRITLTALTCRPEGPGAVPQSGVRWCTAREIAELPMPAPYRRIARALAAP